MALTLVTTLPPATPGGAALRFAQEAWLAGAEALELRSDLHDPQSIDVDRISSILPVMISERGTPLPACWLRAARFVDLPLAADGVAARLAGLEAAQAIASHHACAPMEPGRAVELWEGARVPPGTSIKHVEPLGALEAATRLLMTQRLLTERFGEGRVTVLATGELALPIRCLLAVRNGFDFVALGDWAAAVGQRRLSDAVRDRRPTRATGARRAILGSRLAHSRSPAFHGPPFDRLELPPDSQLDSLLPSLWPHYDGLAVTSPFKKAAAKAARAPMPAVNTLVRRDGAPDSGWVGFNTDVAGAREALRRLGGGALQILGEGGATAALRMACRENGRSLTVFRREALPAEPLSGPVIWTWPAELPIPERLAFQGCHVGVIAYGEPGRRIGAAIRSRGGIPVALGATWFAAQAREQRRLWDGGS